MSFLAFFHTKVAHKWRFIAGDRIEIRALFDFRVYICPVQNANNAETNESVLCVYGLCVDCEW